MQGDSALHTAEAKAKLDADRLDEALAAAWRAYDCDPSGPRVRRLLARVLHERPSAVPAERMPVIESLLSDEEIDPDWIAPSGWLCLKGGILSRDAAADLPALARGVEASALARLLLDEALVADHAVEARLTALRRWLLLSGRWREFPATVGSLAAQAAHNGGAWLFDEDERRALEAAGTAAIAAAYRPERPAGSGTGEFGDATTGAVAKQYERWPYPVWRRLTRPDADRDLAAEVRRHDPQGPDTIPAAPAILVAGCGTGREPATLALRYPAAAITAIDLSETSLGFARARANALGLRIDFRRLDLHEAARLGRSFDAIFCSGVLHHLPEPETGWAALAAVLKPGGAMRIMVYSKLARMRIRALRTLFPDLVGRPVDADLLREVRRRVIARAPAIPTTRDFYALAAVHDLLLHRHEDPFDVERIHRAIDCLGLQLLAFGFPDRGTRLRYAREHPDDPLFRSFANWQAFELRQPTMFARMYRFWCRKPA